MISKSNVKCTDSNVKFADSEVRMAYAHINQINFVELCLFLFKQNIWIGV